MVQVESFQEIFDRALSKTKLTKEELTQRVNRKLNEFSNLITKDGAIYMVARELGIEVANDRRLRISDIAPGMKNVSIIGRVFKISQITEFTKSNGNKGKVVNIFISDGTGYIRLPLWDEQASVVENELVTLGSIIQINNAFSREGRFGEVEIYLGKFGNIANASVNGLPSYEELLNKYFSMSPRRTLIKDLVPGSFEVKGNIVQVFKSKYLFGDDSDNFLVVSCVIDDGTGDIRVVFFRDVAERLIEAKPSEISELSLDDRNKLVINRLLGREVLVKGRVKKNKLYDRLEMAADDFKDLNVLEESKTLAEEIELKLGV